MSQPTVDDETMLQSALSAGDFRGYGWVQMNTTPYQSTLDPTAWVTMYVSEDAAQAYEAITPESMTTTGPAFPVGGTVVRQAQDQSGKITALTVIVKRESGYFDAVGDLFFGVTDPQGWPEAATDGSMQWGKLNDCATCHEGRAGANYLFGVSLANRPH